MTDAELLAKFTENFSYREMIESQDAARNGILNIPNLIQICNYSRLCCLVAQPLRDITGTLVVTSGFRCPELNVVIKGAKNSRHMRGLAMDIVSSTYSPAQLVNILKEHEIPFHKAIVEFPLSHSGGWLHLEVNPIGVMPAYETLLASGTPDNPIYTIT